MATRKRPTAKRRAGKPAPLRLDVLTPPRRSSCSGPIGPRSDAPPGGRSEPLEPPHPSGFRASPSRPVNGWS